ncbi:hypothetical protein [Halarcobacter sp.]|uniref:hypothetical protein n=1 Tax=Halarcobacter sp. TaxID=2321133 RepID=UPI0029F4E796|nr:hypothetical protein [Halarcobacter sp.]
MSDAISIKKINQKDKPLFVLKVGTVGIQVNRAKAEFICRLLATYLGLEVVESRLKRLDDE